MNKIISFFLLSLLGIAPKAFAQNDLLIEGTILIESTNNPLQKYRLNIAKYDNSKGDIIDNSTGNFKRTMVGNPYASLILTLTDIEKNKPLVISKTSYDAKKYVTVDKKAGIITLNMQGRKANYEKEPFIIYVESPIKEKITSYQIQALASNKALDKVELQKLESEINKCSPQKLEKKILKEVIEDKGSFRYKYVFKTTYKTQKEASNFAEDLRHNFKKKLDKNISFAIIPLY